MTSFGHTWDFNEQDLMLPALGECLHQRPQTVSKPVRTNVCACLYTWQVCTCFCEHVCRGAFLCAGICACFYACIQVHVNSQEGVNVSLCFYVHLYARLYAYLYLNVQAYEPICKVVHPCSCVQEGKFMFMKSRAPMHICTHLTVSVYTSV